MPPQLAQNVDRDKVVQIFTELIVPIVKSYYCYCGERASLDQTHDTGMRGALRNSKILHALHAGE